MTEAVCPSDDHGDTPPPARVPGVFSAEHINGRPPERCTYCVRCARAGYLFGFFTPDDEDLRDAFRLWAIRLERGQRLEPGGQRDEHCRVYWGSHGCHFPRGHDPVLRPHACGCAVDPDEFDEEGPNPAGRPPYYGPGTRFYGEDAEALGLPLVEAPVG